MQWASTASDEPSLERAMVKASRDIRAQLGGTTPQLVFVFVSSHHASSFARVPELVAAELGAELLIGCSAGGVIGGAREIEQRPGVSLTAARLPGVVIVPFHLETRALPSRTAGAHEWEQLLGVSVSENPHFLIIPDPLSFDAEALIRGLDTAYPASRKIGGLASGGRHPGANALFLRGRVYRSGAVGVALSGNIEVDTIVAQGCRPIGEPMFVTRCDRHILWELDGRRPVEVLHDVIERLDERDRELVRRSLFLGIAMREDREEYRQGDFLIRNIVGLDAASGALAIGAMLCENSVVQFHLRDAHTSAADLEELLAGYERGLASTRPQGSLLFSCLGRGQFLYGQPDHDTRMFQRHLGDVPLGGFFCNGEIGPVHGTTFLHGYTSAFGLFRRRR